MILTKESIEELGDNFKAAPPEKGRSAGEGEEATAFSADVAANDAANDVPEETPSSGAAGLG